jgi:hypothetical protein
MSDNPLIERHAGVWEGVITEFDPNTGAVLDRRASRITMKLDGSTYWQRNEYRWDDGRAQSLEFQGRVEDGAIVLDVPQMQATARPLDERTMYFATVRPGDPPSLSHEYNVLLSPDHRCRSSMHFRDGKLTSVTIFDEHKVG